MSTSEKAEIILIVVKRVAKWIILGPSVIIFAVVAYLMYEDYSNKKPKIVSEHMGVVLGEKKTDFIFKNPDFKLINYADLADMEGEFYFNNAGTLYVHILNEVVHGISYICMKELEYTSINGVVCNGSGEDLKRIYKDNLTVQCLLDKKDEQYSSYRVYDSVRYGIRHHVISNKISGFEFFGTQNKNFSSRVAWGACL